MAWDGRVKRELFYIEIRQQCLGQFPFDFQRSVVPHRDNKTILTSLKLGVHGHD
jgi:hypothetical protein